MNRTTGSAAPGWQVAPPHSPDRRRGLHDRRESGRHPFVAAVRHEPEGGRVHLGQAANLGVRGMQVRRRAYTAEPALPLHTPVAVAFSLPDGGETLRLRAEVVFDQPQGAAHHLTGLRFAEVPPEVEARLRSFLDAQR